MLGTLKLLLISFIIITVVNLTIEMPFAFIGVMLIAFILILLLVKTKKYLNIFSKFFIVTGCIITCIFVFVIFFNFKTKSSVESANETIYSADGFTIENYKVVLDVSKSNAVEVKEYITVDFYESGHHGIYRFIPEWSEYTDKNGNTESRKSKITNLSAIDQKYTVDIVKNKKRIKIGDANKTLNVGSHNYEIHYTYNMGNDPYDNFDEFIFHAFGDYWGTRIKNASLEIHLPNDVNINDNLHFYADKYRQKDITSYVDYYVSENTIYATLSPKYKLTKSLTIDLELPEGYFIKASNNYGNVSLIICILCILFAITSFIMWKRNGKDFDKVPETVEFYPPDGLDVAEIGYIYKEDTGRKLSIALIVELASKGFIKIIESEDKKKQTIVKFNTTDVNKAIKRQIKVIKLKDYKRPILDLHPLSTEFMKEHFKDNNDSDIITSDFDSFYINTDYLVKKGYIKIEYDSIEKYKKEALENVQEYLKANEFKDKPKMTSNEEIVYNKLFEDGDETVLSENRVFYTVFNQVAENVRVNIDSKINDIISYKLKYISSFMFLISIIMSFISYVFIKDLSPKLNFLYYLSFISIVVTLIFSILMQRKTSYGEQIKARINGFKNYIELAEKSQLEMLVEQNPNYFYDILPFAYVLDVSKKWVERFENIPIPTNDMGNFDYCNIGAIDALSDSVYIPSSSSSGGGCSSCGGGCSSCGGGCSSCGGGGSW